MTLHITPAIIEAAYVLICETPPFRRWKLPSPDDLEFYAVPLPDNDQGELMKKQDGKYRITVNPNRHKTLRSMLETLAHEVAHIRQDQLGKKDHHGKSFQKLARQICTIHLFDEGQF